MSIFFDFDVGPRGRRFRRAVDGDKDFIELLVDSSHSKLFGDVNIGELIELSTLSICMINAEHKVTGFMALCDFPNVPGVDPAHWEMWIRNLFQKFYLARNTLFIHFICCAKEVEDFFMEEALISVFQNDVYILQILIMVPTSCPQDYYLKYQVFRKRNIFKCNSTKCEDVDCNLFFYVAMRREFCPKLKIRRAVEEDNDDITAILDQKCSSLKDLYGEYYISEMIGRHPEMNRKIIVADSKAVAVGVMCLNSDVNYETLQDTYELEPYHGLMKATALEKEKNKRSNKLLRTFGEPIMMGHWTPFEQIMKYEAAPVDDELSKEKLVEPKMDKKMSKVNFEKEHSLIANDDDSDIQERSLDDYDNELLLNYISLHRPSEHSIVELLEGDSFDYEIVNIDTNLFTVPSVPAFSSESFVHGRAIGPTQSKISEMIKRRNIIRRISNYKGVLPTSPSTKYGGKPNAFMIELFGFREDIDARYGFDLLEAAFEIMKTYDYCIIRVPCTEMNFPLLQHFCFVPTKPDVCSRYALYVAHRSSVTSKLRVRRAELIDIPQIAQLMQSLDGKETIWTVEHTIMKRTELNAYVFLSGVSVVGVGILEPSENVDIVRAKFNIDSYHIHKYHYTGMGSVAGFSTMKAVLAYPVFEPHYRFFIRDMMRQSDVQCLLWLTAYRNKWVIHKANSLAPAMIPLLPRKYELDYDNIEDLRYINKLSNTLTSFSAWFISKKLCSVPKVNIDTRIVIIGASRTATAFINKLVFSDASSYLFFTNVTLVSRGGLPYLRHSKTVAEKMFLKREYGSERYLKSVPYTYYINVVQGTMVEINKKDKYVRLANNSKCYYDMLFLFFGKQYQHPNYLRSALERERAVRHGTFKYTRLDEPLPPEEIVSDDCPDNVFIITCMGDANKALKYVANLIDDNPDYKIIVYGSSIHVYCCLNTLIDMKIPGENIVFAEPFPPLNSYKTRVSLFCNSYVDDTVMKMIDKLNITVYRSCYFQSWTVDVVNIATHVDFISNFQILSLECGALFYYDKRSIDEQAFSAINKSGIVYDGGIVIDHEFRTRDPSIYAAGPVTRYSTRYHADNRRQKYYDSYEVGTKLGSQIRNQLDPLFTESKDKPKRHSVRFSVTASEGSRADSKVSSSQELKYNTRKKSGFEDEYKLPNFTKPKVTHCTLPGGLQYLEVRPPASKIPHHYVQSLHYSGHVLETYKAGYFKLHLTNELIVDGITCLTTGKYFLEHFTNLYGLSAVVLNNVHLRYSAQKLDDFYAFFHAPWAVFLYHDQAEELFAMVKELLPKGQHKGDTLAEGLRSVARKLSKTEAFKASTMLKIRSNFEKSPHIEAITDYVIEWLSENEVLLPMYLQPSLMSNYTYDVKNNPVFRRRKRRLSRLLTAIF